LTLPSFPSFPSLPSFLPSEESPGRRLVSPVSPSWAFFLFIHSFMLPFVLLLFSPSFASEGVREREEQQPPRLLLPRLPSSKDRSLDRPTDRPTDPSIEEAPLLLLASSSSSPAASLVVRPHCLSRLASSCHYCDSSSRSAATRCNFVRVARNKSNATLKSSHLSSSHDDDEEGIRILRRETADAAANTAVTLTREERWGRRGLDEKTRTSKTQATQASEQAALLVSTSERRGEES